MLTPIFHWNRTNLFFFFFLDPYQSPRTRIQPESPNWAGWLGRWTRRDPDLLHACIFHSSSLSGPVLSGWQSTIPGSVLNHFGLASRLKLCWASFYLEWWGMQWCNSISTKRKQCHYYKLFCIYLFLFVLSFIPIRHNVFFHITIQGHQS